MIKHLRDFHCQVQALSSLNADVTDGTVTQEAVDTQTAEEVTVAGDGLAAAQGANTLVAASHRGQETVQWVAEQAGQKE